MADEKAPPTFDIDSPADEGDHRGVSQLRDETRRLRRELAARMDAADSRELELSAALRDAELKTAYSTALERWLGQREADLAWFRHHLDQLGEITIELPQVRARAELAESRASAAEARVRESESRVGELEIELALLRRRRVVRLADAWSTTLRGHPLLWRALMRTLNVADRRRVHQVDRTAG